MTKDEMIDYMLEKKMIVKRKTGYFLPPKRKVKQVKKIVWCKNFPHDYKELAIGVIYDLLIADANIPQWSNGSIKYLLITQTDRAEKALKKILTTETIDYKLFVSALNNYYSSGREVSKISLAKLLAESNWKHIYSGKKNYNKPDNMSWQ